MPSTDQAAKALGTFQSKGKGRVRRHGTQKWEKAGSGTKLYPGDEIDMRKGSGSIEGPGGSSPVREGSFTRMNRELPRVKRTRKDMKIESGVASYGRK